MVGDPEDTRILRAVRLYRIARQARKWATATATLCAILVLLIAAMGFVMMRAPRCAPGQRGPAIGAVIRLQGCQ